MVREDPVREGLLFAGTEFGMFMSYDDGKNWQPFQQNLPVTPITDIKIHRGDLVLSTMGRAFWVMDNVATLRQKEINALAGKAVLFKPETTVRYRYPLVRRGGTSFPKYPTPAAIVDYYLPNDENGLVTIEFFDASGNMVNAYHSEKEGNADSEVIEDMYTSTTTYILDESIADGKGLQRFSWDMRYTGPWNTSESRSYKNGPLAGPGAYTVKLTVNGESLEQSFDLIMDPRVTEGGTTEADIIAQHKFQEEVIALMNEANKLQDDLDEERKDLMKKKEAEDISDVETTRLGTVEKALDLLKTEDLIYPPAMLTGQIRYLYNMLNRADQMPGKDAYDRLTELQSEFSNVKSMAGD